MHPSFQQLLKDATSLTRKGDLRAATAAIQEALSSHGGASASRGQPPIDVEAFVIPDGPGLPGTQHAAPAAAPASEVAGPGFTAGRYANRSGHREYKLFVPSQAGAQPLPLVVMLHGCTQDPDDFAAGTAMNELAQQQGFYVLYPAQSKKNNPQRCWNWFKHSHQARGRGEPALLAEMTREVMAKHAIDPSRVYVAGLSAGGAMAAILGQTYPDLFAAVGVHSGLPAGVATDLPSALAAMRSGPAKAGTSGSGSGSGSGSVPTIVFHGDADATVHPKNGEHIAAANAGTTGEAQRASAPGGRAYTRHVHRSSTGTVVAEHWVVHGAPHAWSGGSSRGSYTDPQGPDASSEMLRFFLEHPRPTPL